MNIGIQQYRRGSRSARLLQVELEKIYPFGRVLRAKPDKARIKINWGSSRVIPNTLIYLNHPQKVKYAIDKRLTFEKLNGKVPVPPFTTDEEEAYNWVTENEWKLVARLKPNGAHGEGIKIIRSVDEFEEAPLYTRFFPRKKEYRVIICGNHIVAYMRKILKPELRERGEGHSEIRNSDRYVFVNLKPEAVQTRGALKEIAFATKEAMELDFCAIDVIKNLQNGQFYVLEVNTAFGLGENNARKMARAIVSLLGETKLKRVLETTKLNSGG